MKNSITRVLGIFVLFIAVISGFGAVYAQKKNDNQLSGAAACVEPFCSFAPVKLSAVDMADAVRKIVAQGEINYQFTSYNRNERNAPPAKKFLANNDLQYVDPTFIAENINDKRLHDLFSEDCLYKLTHKKASGSSSVGPFFVYHMVMNKEPHIVVAIFGWSIGVDQKDDPEKGYNFSESTGFVNVLKDNTSCEIVRGRMLSARPAATDAKNPYLPRFFGVGYDHGKPFAYELSGKTFYKNLYSLEYWGLNPEVHDPDQRWFVYISRFPDDFNPFTLLSDKKE